MSTIKPDETLNLLGVVCPINFVKTKLKLEEMDENQILEVYLDEGEPIRNVPRSVKEEGHTVVKVIKEEDHFKLYIKKGK